MQRPGLAAALVAALASVPSPAGALTRCEVLDAAQRWVDAGVMYSWDAWYTDPTTGRCCYRTDCSGFVSAVWQLPPPGHTTYSFATGPWDDGASYAIDPSELQPGDALNYAGSPSAGTGHVMLYVAGDFASGWVEVYEEYGHGHPAVRRWRSIDTSLYVPIRLRDIQPCCEPGCDGTRLVGADCSSGDCAAYGADCVHDDLGPRCRFFACPARGATDVCVSDSVVGSCVDGALVSQGDCGAYGAICTTAGGQPAHCASVFCVASPEEAPVEHEVCLPDGGRYRCDGAGGLAASECPAGERCSVYPEVHCEADPPCPAEGEAEVCAGDDAVVRCAGGAAVEVLQDCAVEGGLCRTPAGGPPRCVSRPCVEALEGSSAEHDVCLPDGSIGRCSAAGELVDESPCPEGTACSGAGDGIACVEGSADGPTSEDGSRPRPSPGEEPDAPEPGGVSGGCTCAVAGLPRAPSVLAALLGWLR